MERECRQSEIRPSLGGARNPGEATTKSGVIWAAKRSQCEGEIERGLLCRSSGLINNDCGCRIVISSAEPPVVRKLMSTFMGEIVFERGVVSGE